MNQSERLRYLISSLQKDMPEYSREKIPDAIEQQKMMLRALTNIRPPKPVTQEFLYIQDGYLQEELSQKNITNVDGLSHVPSDSRLYLWQGDITTLRVDAIVNAANSQMLGCFVPCHKCIDNAIHSSAGIQLRLTCGKMMERQGHTEPIGTAKITPGYNLPCGYVLHTVGPVVQGAVTGIHRKQLKRCYQSCLELAAQNQLESIAFCCISTGEFHFPQEEAAEIAVVAVKEFLNSQNQIKKVLFNVFTTEDAAIYRKLLEQGW